MCSDNENVRGEGIWGRKERQFISKGVNESRTWYLTRDEEEGESKCSGIIFPEEWLLLQVNSLLTDDPSLEEEVIPRENDSRALWFSFFLISCQIPCPTFIYTLADKLSFFPSSYSFPSYVSLSLHIKGIANCYHWWREKKLEGNVDRSLGHSSHVLHHRNHYLLL